MFVSSNNIINLYIYILYIYIYLHIWYQRHKAYEIDDMPFQPPRNLKMWLIPRCGNVFMRKDLCLTWNHRFQVCFVNSMWTHVFCHFHPKEIVDQSVREGDQVLMPGTSWHIVPAAVAYNIWFIWSSVSCFTSLCERRSDMIRYDQIPSDPR